MRTIEWTSRFKRDFKRELKGRHRRTLQSDLSDLVSLLIADVELPTSFRDHALVGEWSDFRDCHVKPDLILIYRKSESEILQLVRLGSHSELGL